MPISALKPRSVCSGITAAPRPPTQNLHHLRQPQSLEPGLNSVAGEFLKSAWHRRHAPDSRDREPLRLPTLSCPMTLPFSSLQHPPNLSQNSYPAASYANDRHRHQQAQLRVLHHSTTLKDYVQKRILAEMPNPAACILTSVHQSSIAYQDITKRNSQLVIGLAATLILGTVHKACFTSH